MSTTPGQPLVTAALAHLQANWATFFPGAARPNTLGYLLQGTGVGKLILFVLADRAARPCCVVKLPRSPRDNASLRHEYDLVSELRRRGGAAVRDGLPRPIAAFEIDQWQVTVEHMLAGQLLSGLAPVGAAFNLPAAARQLRLVRQWLVAAHTATAEPPQPLGPQDLAELFLEPIARMLAATDLRPSEREYLSQLRLAAQRFSGRELPLGFSHGDLRPGNILMAGDTPCVIDWQFGQLRALPLLDWFEFAFRYFCDAIGLEELAGEQAAYRTAFEAVYLGTHPYARLVAAETRAYAQALRLPPDSLGLLLGLWLVSNTNKYLTFLGERAERGYLFLMQPAAGDEGRLSFRQQLRRQVYVTLLGQLADHDQGAAAAGAAVGAAFTSRPQLA